MCDPTREYAIPVQAWAPWQVGDIERLEKVQKKMVATILGLKRHSYEDKLSKLGLSTLAERREMLDLQLTYQISSGKADLNPDYWFKPIAHRLMETRLAAGGLNLAQPRARLDLRRNFFSPRVVEPWNSLLIHTKSASKVYQFKKRLRS